ncbi:hypothetical protein GQ43DRAFT_441729 [Delitschia confertaspora ATCC 74209]|uniref:ER membrane protein complex subunit 7 beta-sandwich domain-containing protein n=1 Tax=Delitschia confertaspora ATCC 74209 TaxID=1513339 RepID=A0A9P4JL87_9PLEO|nr:hypothetical protein GQ43DRAFT_441729 [Delitschia confertaspora ATCC 74209]
MHATTLLLAYLVSTASAARFILHVPTTANLNPTTLPPTTHATLQFSGAPISVPISRSNTFTFTNVTAGSYLATIHSHTHFFEPLRIDVSSVPTSEGSTERKEVIKTWQTFLGNEWDNKGESRGEGGNGLVVDVRVLGAKEYYQERSGFNVLGFLKSPMILMAIVGMGLVFGMPYLMENMDEETKAEFEAMQKKSPMAQANPAQQLQNFDLASWMAGKTDQGPSKGASLAAQGQARKR